MIELKTPALRAVAVLFFAALSCSVHARTVMTVTCNEPNGIRFDFYEGEFQEEQDGFAGIAPKIVFDDAKPQLATVLYQPAAAAKAQGFKESIVFKIMVQTTEQITMVSAPDEKNMMQMYSIYPKQGVGYFTIHRYNAVKDGEASAGVLSAKCNITKQ
jgi:hypothetical protein